MEVGDFCRMKLKSFERKRVNSMNKKSNFKRIRIAAALIAAVAAIIIAGVNTSSVFAEALSKVPVVGNIVKVITFREYTVNEDTYKADIKAPAIKGLENNKALENSLNEKYLKEAEEQYKAFMADMEYIKEIGGGHAGIKSGYEVKTDTDKILAILRYNVSTSNSYSETKYDTVDKQKQILLTLPMLFKDDSYVKMISDNVKKQMLELNKADSSNYYWIEGIEKDPKMISFKEIAKDQSFYINPQNKLVICFEKYEVAPGAMGHLEFVIPTEILSDSLVSNEYMK
ncbi:MAG TPA: DUF3298 and DUF4163 domain-containing protein [Bacillales bacterium]|nr:DUF3298 and DUF4163 domain-containing protein [Bacillales bacterium]